MIRLGRITNVVFGKGTVEVRTFPDLKGNVAYLQLTACGKTEVGKAVEQDNKKEKPNIVRMAFDSVQSVDIVLAHLNDIRDSLLGDKNGQEV